MNKVGLAIDIDGVIVRGGKLIPSAINALSKVKEAKIPFVFVTNGGGITEESKALDLSKKLKFDIAPSQVLLSHTPLKRIVPEFGRKNTLIVGSKSYLEVAQKYGFTKIITSDCVHKHVPETFPLRSPRTHHISGYDGKGIECAIVFYDPVDWALDMQVLCDTLLGATNHTDRMHQTIPLYACNSDLVYMDQHPFPRFTQGAFTRAFQCLFEKYSKSKLRINFCGKPFKIQYEMAESLLKDQASHSIERFYGIGDNPKADIRGANRAGNHWSSVLVRTGVFQGENDAENPADIVVNDINDAVDRILRDNR